MLNVTGKRPNAFVCGQTVGATAFVNESFFSSEISPFWGLFEGNASQSEPVDATAGTPSSSDGSGIVAGILGLLGGGVSTLGQLAPVLPALGIGSKSRIAETEAKAAANKDLIGAQAAATLASQEEQTKKTTMYIAGGVLFMVMIVVIVIASKAL